MLFVNFLSEFSRGHISEMSPVLFSALISKYSQVIMGMRAGAGNPWEMQNKGNSIRRPAGRIKGWGGGGGNRGFGG